MPVPNFLYIGAPKAGSSWLFEALRPHPQIYVPSAKDIQFFDQHYHKGWDWYQAFFAEAAGALAVGELSHDYFMHEDAAERIRQHLPEVKLICCLREPAELTLSAYQYARNHAATYDVGLINYSELEVARRQVDYLHNLRLFFTRFERAQIHVAFFDELKASPGRFLADIYRFLGVDPQYIPDVLDHRVNATKTARLPWIARRAYAVAGVMRSMGLANLVGIVKRNFYFDRLLYQPGRFNPPLSPEERERLAQLRRRSQRTYPTLERLIGRRLPEAWYAEVHSGSRR